MDINKIASSSSLITPELEAQIQGVFEKLEGEAGLVCVIDPDNSVSVEMAELVRHIAGLTGKLSCRIYDKAEAEENAPELDASLLPVTGLYRQEQYSGVSFHGVTGGKEMNSLIFAIYNVAGPGQEMEKRMKKKLEKLTHKSEIKIFVSLSCHHCAQQVITCQKMAAECEAIEARMIDARLYPELVEKYKIERIPMTVINEKEVLLGSKNMDEIYQILRTYK